jgi:hypothetical protein
MKCNATIFPKLRASAASNKTLQTCSKICPITNSITTKKGRPKTTFLKMISRITCSLGKHSKICPQKTKPGSNLPNLLIIIKKRSIMTKNLSLCKEKTITQTITLKDKSIREKFKNSMEPLMMISLLSKPKTKKNSKKIKASPTSLAIISKEGATSADNTTKEPKK